MANLHSIEPGTGKALRHPTSRLLALDSSPALYDQAFDRAGEVLAACWLRLEGERAAAVGQIARLLDLPAGRRGLLVRNSERLRTWGVLERLVGAARQALAAEPADPEGAEDLVALALDLAKTIDPQVYPRSHRMDLEARAWGCRARARQQQGDLPGAETALGTSYRCLLEGSRDGWERAVWLELKAELRREQGRWHEAEAALRRATAIFKEIGDDRRAGRCLTDLGEVHRRLGQAKSAASYGGQAVALLRGTEPELLAKALSVQLTALSAAGRWFEAGRAFAELSGLARRNPRLQIPLADLRRLTSPIPRALVE
ncbi:MAG TPA: tetratricopeptide repeat protein [Thermoanaerobaculia bacterium]|jgi:tetratricopeptide (TPR) repeat protein|nr:tetratricopeptide repeat protein [Thermoanaerobaculia bacterium]